MQKPKISVLIPVFNKVDTLRECLESVLSQTMKEIEVICVNDGSTDRSAAFLEEFLTKDERIIIRYQKNAGAGAAKNAALKTARGDYVAFLDADDMYACADALKILYESAIDRDALICGGSIQFWKNGEKLPAVLEDVDYAFYKEGWVDYREFQQDYYFQRFIFKRDFLIEKGIRFMPGSQYEDPLFLVSAMLAAKSFYAVPVEVYAYRMTDRCKSWSLETQVHALESLAEELSISSDNGLNTLHHRIIGHMAWYLDWFEQHFKEKEARELKLALRLIKEKVLPEVYKDERLSPVMAQLEQYLRQDNTTQGDELSVRADGNETVSVCIKKHETKETPTVSVIVPVYNVEPYLQECLDSLISQTMSDIEIICVNDGSTDRSLSIALHYSEADPRISIYAQENQGLSEARNTGAAHAAGDYIYFMDSDDLLEKDALMKLHKAAVDNKADVIFCDADTFAKDKDLDGELQKEREYLRRTGEYPGVCTGALMAEKMLSNGDYKAPVWLQLINREFYVQNGLSFIPGILHEDNAFTFHICLKAKRAAYIPEHLYKRRIRNNSIMTDKRSFDNVKGYFYSYLEMCRLMREAQPEKREKETFDRIKQNVLDTAFCIYDYLDEAEQSKWKELPEEVAVLFEKIFIAKDMNGIQADPEPTDMTLSREAAAVTRTERSITTERQGMKDAIISRIRRMLHRLLPATRHNVSWSYEHLTDQLQSHTRMLGHVLSSGYYTRSELDAFERKLEDIGNELRTIKDQQSRIEDNTVKESDSISCTALSIPEWQGFMQVMDDFHTYLELADMQKEETDHEKKESIRKEAETLRQTVIHKFQALDFEEKKLSMGLPKGEREAFEEAIMKDKPYLSGKFSKSFMESRLREAGALPASAFKDSRLLPNREEALKYVGEGGIAGEVGVAYGDFSQKILTHLKPEHFYAIDIFGNTDFWDRHDLAESGLDHEEWYRRRFKELIPEKMTVCKGLSWETLDRFEDDYFDYLYIDAVHAYDGVSRDIEAAVKKVKDGGIIQFNDYTLWDVFDDIYYGVVPAVNEFVRRTNSEILFYCLDEYGFDDIVIRLNKPCEEAECLKKNELGTEPDVSVVVPVYNVSAYLPECLDSLVSQTLHNIEIICVDDGSTDDSLKIALEYAKRDKRISVYSQRNRGLSAARNTGASFAHGRYIHFTDSDDMLEATALEKLSDRAYKDKLEVIFCDAKIVCAEDKWKRKAEGQSRHFKRKHEYKGVYTGPELMKKMMLNNEYREPVWQLLIDRDFYKTNEFGFIEGIFYEDIAFTFRALALSKRAGCITEALYIRRVRSDSITTREASFKHVKGYFLGSRDMEKTLEDSAFTRDERKPFELAIKRIRLLARECYYSLDEKEREFYRYLSLKDRNAFERDMIEVRPLREEYPSYFFIELTRNCNLSCPMCRQEVMEDKSWFMEDGILEKALAAAEKYAKVVDLRRWGESTLDDRLIPIALRLKEKGIKTRLYSNFNARDEQYYRELAGTGIEIAISIESGNGEKYRRLRRGGELQKVERHLEAFIDECRKEGLPNLPYFTTVVSDDNLDELDSLVELAAKHGIGRIELNPIQTREGGRSFARIGNTEREAAMASLKRLASMAEDKGVAVLTAATLFNEYSVPLFECIHPRRYCVIEMDGTVNFCDHARKCPESSMGNLKDMSLEEIWNGDRFKEIRLKHQHFDFADLKAAGIECNWCVRNRYGNSEYLVEPGIEPIPLKEYLSGLERLQD